MFSQDRLARFFVRKDGFYRVSRDIRDSVTLVAHSVLVDPPFLKMYITVSCVVEPKIAASMAHEFNNLFGIIMAFSKNC